MKKTAYITLAAALILFAGSCDRNGSNDSQGRLVIKVTDDPFDINNIESATVKITKVEIKKTGDGIKDGNSWVTLSEDTVTVDILDLRNGVTQTLLDLQLPEGEYDYIRLYVDEAGLKLIDLPDTYNVKVPSGQQTGIKIHVNPSVVVSGGLTSELLIDFDLSRSFVLRGNMNNNNGFIFKPVIRATNLTTAGRIEGMVKDTSDVKVKEAKVWITKDTIMATTFADTMGYYNIIGVPVGSYSISATKEGFDTVSFDNISVIAGNRTIQNFVLTKK
jgi:hypothetical protein